MLKEIIYKLFKIDEKPCASCEVLREQLSVVNIEKEKLLNLILEKNKPVPEPQIDTEELKPITSKYVPWKVRREMLEAEDREKARVLREVNESLEKEVLEAK